MRVVHVVPRLFGERGVYGGGERYAFELARHMAEVTPTSLVTFGAQDEESMSGRLKVRVIGNPSYVRRQQQNPFAWRLFRELTRAEVVHCHQRHVLASTVAAAYCRLTGRRVYVTDLGGGGWDLPPFVSNDRLYHGHLHVSCYSRRIAGHEADPRARVILGGVDRTLFCPDPTVSRKGTVLFVGRLLPHKGIEDLVKAIDGDTPLEIIGREGMSPYVAELERLAVGKQILFRRDVDDEGLVRAYRSAACVVLPSVYETLYGQRTVVPELLGQTLLEAMACGTPVICTAVASLPEVVRDGVDGFVVAPNDPQALRARIDWLRRRPDEASRMGEAGRARVLASFSWAATVQRCLDAYAR